MASGLPATLAAGRSPNESLKFLGGLQCLCRFVAGTVAPTVDSLGLAIGFFVWRRDKNPPRCAESNCPLSANSGHAAPGSTTLAPFAARAPQP